MDTEFEFHLANMEHFYQTNYFQVKKYLVIPMDSGLRDKAVTILFHHEISSLMCRSCWETVGCRWLCMVSLVKIFPIRQAN